MIDPHMFGAPGTGVHEYRVFNLAIVDVLGTITIAYILHRLFSLHFISTVISLFMLGIIMHHIVGVRTTVDKFLFT